MLSYWRLALVLVLGGPALAQAADDPVEFYKTRIQPLLFVTSQVVRFY